MAYEIQTWPNEDPQSQVNETRMGHIENGIANAYNVSLIAISDTAPSECSTGDKYFNTSTKLIYTATATDTWGTAGETPISDKFYVILEVGSLYIYNGDTLIKAGIDKTDIKDATTTSDAATYSCNYANDKFARKYICAREDDRWTQSFTSWTATPMKISTSETSDSAMFIHDSANKKITIGAGVSKIKITSQVSWTNANAVGEFDLYITKNGQKAYQLYNTTSTGISNISGAPFILNVQEGDYIQLCMFGGISSAQILTTIIIIEKME